MGRNGELFLAAGMYCTHTQRLPAACECVFARVGVCCARVGECPEAISCSLTHPTNIQTDSNPLEGPQQTILASAQSVSHSGGKFIHGL